MSKDDSPREESTHETRSARGTPGLTDEDRTRIGRFLKKPPHQRTPEDLLPDDDPADELRRETTSRFGTTFDDRERIRAFLTTLPCHRTVDDLVAENIASVEGSDE